VGFLSAESTLSLRLFRCVYTIENALSALQPPPKHVEVSVVLQTVNVYHNKNLTEDAIRAAIIKEGFDLMEGLHTNIPAFHDTSKHLQYCELCQHEQKLEMEGSPSPSISSAPRKPSANSLKIVFSVHGMTCSSCSNSITNAVSDVPGVRSVTVSLLDNSAIVVVDSGSVPLTVQEAIEDCGFEATVVEIVPIESDMLVPKPECVMRTVSLRVEGMFCQ
jgi:P-type Cu+ transporter